MLVTKLAVAHDRFVDAHRGYAPSDLRSLQPKQRNYRLADTSYFAPGTPIGDEALPRLAVKVRSPGESITAQQRKCESWI